MRTNKLDLRCERFTVIYLFAPIPYRVLPARKMEVCPCPAARPAPVWSTSVSICRMNFLLGMDVAHVRNYSMRFKEGAPTSGFISGKGYCIVIRNDS